MHKGDETIRSYMRGNYHLVVAVDETSESVKEVGVKPGNGIQAQDFPFPFHLPLPLHIADSELQDVHLYGIKAYDVLAVAHGVRLD